ncbi:MAG: RNase adapter RapZ [Sandaracinaceae bacterium]
MAQPLQVVVVTGMSGAGRSSALRVLEDLGYYCVDNLPPALARSLAELVEGDISRVGLGIDVRTGAFLESAIEALDGLAERGHDPEVLFLDCNDDVLVRRFSETRRPHPLAPDGDVLEGIRAERERLGDLRARARHVIDTTASSVHELRRALIDYIARGGGEPRMAIRVVSFGFKYGIPVDADLVFDLRYLPNPHFVPELRQKTGLEADVADYVLESEASQEFLRDLENLLAHALPRYEREGKAYLTIAIGCTGGRHRSVAMAEVIGRWLRQEGRDAVSAHRDVARGEAGRREMERGDVERGSEPGDQAR